MLMSGMAEIGETNGNAAKLEISRLVANRHEHHSSVCPARVTLVTALISELLVDAKPRIGLFAPAIVCSLVTKERVVSTPSLGANTRGSKIFNLAAAVDDTSLP